MRIIFVTNNYKPYSGGVVSSIDATMQELRSKGHEVILVTLNFTGTSTAQEENLVRIYCPVRFMYKTNCMALPWKATETLVELARSYRPDIIHVHHPFLLGVSGLHAAQAIGIPCVFTYHTMYEFFSHYFPVPAMCSQPVIRWLVDRFCSSVDGIIAPCTLIKHDLRNKGIILPIEVIPSSLRAQFIEHHDKNIVPSGKAFFDVLVVSRFSPEKNIPFVFDVLVRLPENVRLTLVGYGTDYEMLHHMAYSLYGFSPTRVRFVHKPAPAELMEMYRSADLFLFPSQSDTQGIVLAEAMSQGLPVVALDGPGQKDIILEGKNGFIVEDELMAARIIHVIMVNSELHKKLKFGALSTSHFYQPEYRINQLLTFYDVLKT